MVDSCTELIGEGFTKRNVYLVRQENGSENIVKPLKVGALKAFLTAFLLEQGKGCPFLPKLRKAESGGYYSWHMGNRYLVTQRILGREADYLTKNDLQTAIITMSAFHQWSRELIANQPQRWLPLQFNPSFEWEHRVREMVTCRKIAIRWQDSFSRAYLRLWHHYHDLACQAVCDLKTENAYSSGVIGYHDWAYHNLLIYQNQGYLVDFDDMLIDQPVHDRANLIGRYLRLHGGTLSALLQILWLFDQHYSWKQGELRWLKIYMTFPFDYWMIGRQYYIERQAWSLKYFRDQFERKVAHPERNRLVLNLLSEFRN